MMTDERPLMDTVMAKQAPDSRTHRPYAAWAGTSLPTGVEWEHAARGGLDRATYPWGGEFMTGGKIMANTQHGPVPLRETSSPMASVARHRVKRFPPNGFELFDARG